MSLRWFIPGATSDTTALVAAETTDADTACRVAYSTSQAMTSPAYSDPVTSDSLGYVQVPLAGLTPGTRYYFQLEIGGTLDTSRTGRFLTDALPPGTHASFSFGHASCAMTDTNHPVFTKIAARDNLAFYAHLGDRDYLDTHTTSEADYLANIRRAFTIPNQQTAWESVALVHIYDDHDGGGDNADSTIAGWPQRISAHRRTQPTYPQPDPDACYTSFTKYGWHFVLTDLRSQRSVDTDPDDGTKSMMGATQLAWFLNECSHAKDRGLTLCWLNSNVWPVTEPYLDRDEDLDHWGAFAVERTTINDHWATIGLSDIVILSGDAHMLAYGTFDFSTSQTAPARVFQAAAMDYDHGIVRGRYWDAKYSDSMGLYATIDVLHVQDDFAGVLWRGWHVDATTGEETLIMSRTFTVGTPPPMFVRNVCTYDEATGEWLPRALRVHDDQITWTQRPALTP